MRRLAIPAALMGFVFVLLTGLLSQVLAQTEEPVHIGVIAAKTGDAASSNLALFEAARFAVQEINEQGGLLGRPVALAEYDNSSTSLGSKVAAEKVVDRGVLAVIGASWSSHSNAMAPVLQAAGIPMISPISTSPDVTRHGDYIFRACFTDPLQARVMARFSRDDLQARTAVTLVNVSRTYSVNLADNFERFFGEFGGKTLWRGEFLIDAADYQDLLDRAAAYAPDVLYVPGDYRDSSFIIKQAREMGMKAHILGGDAFGLRLFDYIGAAANGCHYTTHWHRDSPLPSSRDFVRRYEAAHGLIEQTTIPLTYDAVMLLADAVRRAGSLDRAAVRDALAATSAFVGASGAIRFDEHGDPQKPVVVNVLQDGGITFIRNVAP